MTGLPGNGTPLDCSPLERGQARAIAEAFRPVQAWGNRRDYYYTRGKLGIYSRAGLLSLGDAAAVPQLGERKK